MLVEETPLRGCKVLTPTQYEDSRGWFMESYNHRKFSEAVGKEYQWVQDNHSLSWKGVLRGLHFQKGEAAQTKLVRVVQGEMVDVAVDLRPESPTYKHWFSVTLSAENRKQLLVPKGFAHGFVVLSDTAEIVYKCDAYYAPKADGGIRYNDPELDIDWKVPKDRLVLSEKDLALPTLAEWENER